jgi:hypothetical protein
MNWDQMRTILWLRWRLSSNQFVRGGALNTVAAFLMMGLLLVGAIAGVVGGFAGGLFGLSKAPPVLLMAVWDGIFFAFLIFWMSGIMVELQRSESIDLTKLLHLPVTLSQVFAFNYLASHFTPSVVLCVPGMLALCLGLVLGGGVRFLLLFPLVLGFLFLLTSWTYCLRGWLTALMTNKRRRRTVVVWVTIIFVGLAQLPNLVLNSGLFRNQTRKMHTDAGQSPGKQLAIPEGVLQAHLFVPPGWVGYGAMRLKENDPWMAVAASAVCWFGGFLGLARAYRLTLRFYQGADEKTKQNLEQDASPATPRGRLLVEWRLPWLKDDVCALTLANFRSALRAPELKMALFVPMLVGLVLIVANLGRVKTTPPAILTSIASTACVLFSMFLITPLMSNAFGLDRNGFRLLVLMPVRREHVLLAKNLAFFPFAAGVCVVMLSALKLLVHIPWFSFVSGILQIPSAFFLFCLAANMLSILAPYRVAQGTLQAKKPKAITFLAAFLTMLVLPLLVLPLMIPSGLQVLFWNFLWVPWLPVNVVASALLAGAVTWVYAAILPSQGQLLQRRELKILKEVTEDSE